MKNSICFTVSMAFAAVFFFQTSIFGQQQTASHQRIGSPKTGTQQPKISQPKPDRTVFDANAGYMSYRGKNGRDTASTAFAIGMTFGRRMVAREHFTFESIGNFDVLQFTGAAGGNEIARRLGGNTLFNPQFGFRLTNGQLNNGKRFALGLKVSGGVAANVQNFLKFNFKGIRPDLTLAASPSVALMVGDGRFVGCQLDLSYIGQSTAIAEGLKKGFFLTPRFSFQF